MTSRFETGQPYRERMITMSNTLLKLKWAKCWLVSTTSTVQMLRRWIVVTRWWGNFCRKCNCIGWVMIVWIPTNWSLGSRYGFWLAITCKLHTFIYLVCLAVVQALYRPLVLSLNQLTISLCSNGCTRVTATYCILPPHPHIILNGGSEAIQSCGEHISCNHLCLKWGRRTWGCMILYHKASDWAASILFTCSPLDRYGGGGCCLNRHNGGCRGC